MSSACSWGWLSGILASEAATASGSRPARDLKDATNGQPMRLGQKGELLRAKEVAQEVSSARNGNQALAGHFLSGKAKFVVRDADPMLACSDLPCSRRCCIRRPSWPPC